MKQIKIKDMVRICDAQVIQGNEELIIKTANTDTRKIQEGDIFFAIGRGNEYIKAAIEAGAIACVVEIIDNKILKEYPETTIIKVKDSLKALQQLASYKRSLYDIHVVAITGSVGKTSTKDIVAQVLNEKYKTLKTEGNYNNHIGLPLTILRLEDHEALVVEMGMNHLKEISLLTKIAKPTIAVITNIGTSHIGNLGSRENILKAKLEILEGLDKNGKLVINNDNDLLNNWNKNYENVITYGIEEKSLYEAKELNILQKSSEYNIDINNKIEKVYVPVSGTHFVYNSLCAIAIGRLLSIETEKILNGIKTFKLTAKRMETEEIKGITIINDAYNASYESMKHAIEYLNNIDAKRRIAVLGDMLELGEFSKELHEKVGLEIEKSKVDILITVGKESENINKIANKVKEKYIFDTNEEAIEKLKETIKLKDAVLLKASNGMNFIEILNSLKEFLK